jgi:hypothetical protein
MLIHGFPITAKLPEELGIGERFWYWRGASGRNYIHSIYAADACPPLPGAVYVAVRRVAGERHAVAVGRFSNFWDGSMAGLAGSGITGLDAGEIHVHLLARNDLAAEMVFSDLYQALLERVSRAALSHGFHEAVQPALCAA